MTPLQSLAHTVYLEARAHYKGGIKSSNKIYDGNQPAAWAAKVATRTANSDAFLAAWQTRPNQFVLRGSGMTFVGLGNYLLNTNNTYGNCVEMSAVAAALFLRLSRAPIRVAATAQFDHGFVLIGALPSVCSSMAALVRTPRDMNCWAVDVWAGVSCHPADYLTHFNNKMMWWQAQGKFVSLNSMWRMPTFGFAGLHEASLLLRDPRMLIIHND